MKTAQWILYMRVMLLADSTINQINKDKDSSDSTAPFYLHVTQSSVLYTAVGLN